MHGFRFAALFAMLCLPAASLEAADPSANPFNNSDLSGWTTAAGKPAPAGWEVVDGAIRTAEQARALATAAGQHNIAERNAQLLELYRAGRPYHEPAPPPR